MQTQHQYRVGNHTDSRYHTLLKLQNLTKLYLIPN